MYVPPALRDIDDSQKIQNLCDEFLHIEAIPECKILEMCSQCNMCTRKSVTCVLRLCDNEGICVYDKVYKNKHENNRSAIHAESFILTDANLRKHISFNQTLHLYLTYQPCHYSGGHHKVKNISCTEILIHFYQKVLKHYNIEVIIHFSYLYRAHWKNTLPVYTSMINNSIIGIQLLKQFFILKIMTIEDFRLLTQYCCNHEKNKFFSGDYDIILKKRGKVVDYFQNFIDTFEKNCICQDCVIPNCKKNKPDDI